jgi:glycerophosphoryl diester phosphodiesterase
MHFTFDQEGDGVSKTLNALVQYSNPNRVYGTGVSACSPTQYSSAIALAVKNRNAGVSGLVYTWTIDKTSSINQYLDLKLDGIITNDPAALRAAVDARGLMLAKPTANIPSAASIVVIAH